jgi:hypothetical protein
MLLFDFLFFRPLVSQPPPSLARPPPPLLFACNALSWNPLSNERPTPIFLSNERPPPLPSPSTTVSGAFPNVYAHSEDPFKGVEVREPGRERNPPALLPMAPTLLIGCEVLGWKP